MKRLKLALFLLALAYPANRCLAARSNGIGIVIGYPTAISFKHFTNANSAFQIGVGYWLNSYFWAYIDLLKHYRGVIKTDSKTANQISPYLGVGPTLGAGGRFADVGIRAPLGIEWISMDPPLGVFLEIAPGVQLLPGLFPLVHGGLGIRYFFQ